jgi:negative regulator of flagellin synthesis FlgM
MKVNQNPLSGTHSGAQSVNNKQVDKAKEAGRAAESKNVKSEAAAASLPSTAAQVQISDQAKLMQKATEAVHATADVRQERVAELKERIRAGTYKVDSQSVADKLVEEHFLTDFGKNNV